MIIIEIDEENNAHFKDVGPFIVNLYQDYESLQFIIKLTVL